jgi:chromosome segregation ATPase
MLNDAASSILETDPDEDISEFLNTVNERFVNLESEVARKRDYFGDLVKRWDKFSDRKRRISELFRGTSCVIAKKQIRTRDDVREQLVRCREAIVQLQSSETELSEVAEQGGKLISELRNEGINVDKIEHELHTVVNRYNEMKNRAIKKEEVLQHVSVEMEKIDEGKMELESWLTDVHQQLNSVDEVAIVSQAIQHEVLEKRSLIRSVSAQVLKLQESSNEEAQLDLTAMLQPLHVQWRSLQNLVNPQNSSSESEQNIPSRWKSYSQDDLGSLDAFSEGLGLSRDDVMESGTELMFEEYYDGDLDNWINRLNEFRECLHGYMYSPEDALFEVEQKLNIVQKVKCFGYLYLISHSL